MYNFPSDPIAGEDCTDEPKVLNHIYSPFEGFIEKIKLSLVPKYIIPFAPITGAKPEVPLFPEI